MNSPHCPTHPAHSQRFQFSIDGFTDPLLTVGTTRTRTMTSTLYLTKRRNGYYYFGFFEANQQLFLQSLFNRVRTTMHTSHIGAQVRDSGSLA